MEFYLNKRIWITGASSGLGREVACLLVSYGARLILTARSTGALEELAVSALTGRGTEEAVRVLPGDMEDLDSLKELTEEAWKTFDGLDMVILNAGVSHRSRFVDTTPEVRERVLKVNLLSQMEILSALLPFMVIQGKGHIVSVTSLAGKVSSPLRSCYAAAKHGLHGFLDTLRVETASSGIKVTAVVPGFLKTEISLHALKGDGELWNKNDRNQLSGLEPKKAAERVLSRLPRGKREIYVGYPLRAALALVLGTRFPRLFDRILKKSQYT